MSTRRHLLAGLAAAPLLGAAAWAKGVLRAGDQKGGTRSVMKAALRRAGLRVDFLPR